MDNMEVMTPMDDFAMPAEEIEEIKEDTNSYAEPIVEQAPVVNTDNFVKTESTSTSNFDSLFDNLYNDVAGANNFISNLIEQKKNVGVNEQYLEEEKAKLAKSKSDFEAYMSAQKEAIELEKQRIAEYEKAIIASADSFEPSVIARYLISLCTAFNKFYQECQINCSDSELRCTRANVVKMVRYILKASLSLLGIDCPEQM